MSYNQMLGRDEIINNLLMLDEEISLTFSNDAHYNIIIVGGSALVLIEKISRATMDIDTIECSKELQPYMEHYGINNRVLAYQNNFSCDYMERCIKLDIPTKKLDIYTASLEDIVIAKLFSTREQDAQDIRSPKVIESLNWDILATIADSDDLRIDAFNDHAYMVFRNNYKMYRQEMMK